MADVTRLLDAASAGDPKGAELLPLVYEDPNEPPVDVSGI